MRSFGIVRWGFCSLLLLFSPAFLCTSLLMLEAGLIGLGVEGSLFLCEIFSSSSVFFVPASFLGLGRKHPRKAKKRTAEPTARNGSLKPSRPKRMVPTTGPAYGRLV